MYATTAASVRSTVVTPAMRKHRLRALRGVSEGPQLRRHVRMHRWPHHGKELEGGLMQEETKKA